MTFYLFFNLGTPICINLNSFLLITFELIILNKIYKIHCNIRFILYNQINSRN